MSIAQNIAKIREEIAQAARAAGRDPGEVTLVGASKTHDADACRGHRRRHRVRGRTGSRSCIWRPDAYDGGPSTLSVTSRAIR